MLYCCSDYKAQFLQRMGRLLDNLPEKDNSSQCATPSVLKTTAFTSLRQDDSMARNLPPYSSNDSAKLTIEPSLVLSSDFMASSDANATFCVQSTLASSQLQGPVVVSVMNTEQCNLVSQHQSSSSYCHLSNRQAGLQMTSHASQFNSTSQQPACSQSQLPVPYTRLDVSPSCIITEPVASGTVVRPTCITTSSGFGRGGLSAYDGSCWQPTLNSQGGVESGLAVLRPHGHGQSRPSSRPSVSNDQQQCVTVATKSTAVYRLDYVRPATQS